jgi:hypothetical protein
MGWICLTMITDNNVRLETGNEVSLVTFCEQTQKEYFFSLLFQDYTAKFTIIVDSVTFS